jgi:hypothetical protein
MNFNAQEERSFQKASLLKISCHSVDKDEGVVKISFSSSPSKAADTIGWHVNTFYFKRKVSTHFMNMSGGKIQNVFVVG